MTGNLFRTYIHFSLLCLEVQKQPLGVFYKKAVPKNFAKFTGKLQYRYFPVNFTKFLITRILRRLLLSSTNDLLISMHFSFLRKCYKRGTPTQNWLANAQLKFICSNSATEVAQRLYTVFSF